MRTVWVPAITASACSRSPWNISPFACATPSIDPQLSPAGSQRSHWNVSPVGAFVHVPGVAVRVAPCCAGPPSEGSVSTTGGAGNTTSVAAEAAGALAPPAFDATSMTLIVDPTSSALGT